MLLSTVVRVSHGLQVYVRLKHLEAQNITVQLTDPDSQHRV